MEIKSLLTAVLGNIRTATFDRSKTNLGNCDGNSCGPISFTGEINGDVIICPRLLNESRLRFNDRAENCPYRPTLPVTTNIHK